MDKTVNKDPDQIIVNHCIQVAKELSKEPMYGKPTDIVGFSDVSQKLATKLEDAVGTKEICCHDVNPTNSKYHYLNFHDMLRLSEYMFVACASEPEYLALFDNLSGLNTNCKIIYCFR